MPEEYYEPESGQAIFGAPTGHYDCTDYIEAIFSHLLAEVDRVYWNVYQREFDSYSQDEEDFVKLFAPLSYRSYWWGDEESPEAKLPNLSYDGVELRWYKHFGRGMSLNVQKEPAEWRDWLNTSLAFVRSKDVDLRSGTKNAIQ